MFAQLKPSPGTPVRMPRSNTVLVVDDEEGICETLRDVFEDEGFTVQTVNNGREALSALREATIKPCVVILDLIMPVLDGNAVYAAMKSDPDLAGIQIVISTSDPSRAPAGATVMRKPIALDALLALVHRCC